MGELKVAFNNAGFLYRGNDISHIASNLSTSTNNVLIIGLLERGIDEIYQFNTSSVRLDEKGNTITDAVKLKILTNDDAKIKSMKVHPLSYGNIVCSYLETVIIKLNEFDVIFIRGDDITSSYNIVEVYSEVENPLFFNSPEGTIAAQDKFQIKERAEKTNIKIPKTYNVREFQDLLDALKKIPGKYKVIKARYGFGGKQVWKVNVHTSEEKLWKIFEQCAGGDCQLSGIASFGFA